MRWIVNNALGGDRRGNDGRVRLLLVAAILAVALASPLALFGDRPAAANDDPALHGLSAQEVITALRVAGLPLDDLRPQPIGPAGPSGPPLTEREAWAFTIPSVAPSGGRLLIFADGDKLRKKAQWFTRTGTKATIITHDNVILWLDPALTPPETAHYRQALEGLR